MTPPQETQRHANHSLETLFEGRKAKWLPLYRRLLARFTRIPGIDVLVGARSIAVTVGGQKKPVLGTIRVIPKGLEVGLAISKAAVKSPRLKPIKVQGKRISHRVLISEASEIDDELLSWIKAAQRQARTAKRRSS